MARDVLRHRDDLTHDQRKHIDEIVETYSTNGEKKYKWWMDNVTRELMDAMNSDTSRIHMVRARMKRPLSLRYKLERLLRDPKTRGEYAKINRDNYFRYIKDLLGVRVLVLYKRDLLLVDDFIRRNSMWVLLGGRDAPRVVIDENRAEEANLYRRRGLRVEMRRTGYGSIHYYLKNPSMRNNQFTPCELQVRTIHQEAWGEFSHDLLYPSGTPDPVVAGTIRRISNLLDTVEDIVEGIWRNPADAQFFTQLWQSVRVSYSNNLDDGFDTDACLKRVQECLTDYAFLNRDGPMVAISILTHANSPDIGPKKRIVSLDFGPRYAWGMDAKRILYLDAHVAWKKSGNSLANSGPGDCRQIHKYFVWDNDGRKPSEGTDLLGKYKVQGIDCFEISIELFKLIEKEIKKYPIGKFAANIQFFAWDVPEKNDSERAYAYPLAMLSGTGIYGFYSPTRDPDLLGGVIWYDRDTDSRYDELQRYLSLLDNLREIGIIQPIDIDGTDGPPELSADMKQIVVDEVKRAFQG